MTREQRKNYRKWLHLWEETKELLALSRKFKDVHLFTRSGQGYLLSEIGKFSSYEVALFKKEVAKKEPFVGKRVYHRWTISMFMRRSK
jgi:hypothetical protein